MTRRLDENGVWIVLKLMTFVGLFFIVFVKFGDMGRAFQLSFAQQGFFLGFVGFVMWMLCVAVGTSRLMEGAFLVLAIALSATTLLATPETSPSYYTLMIRLLSSAIVGLSAVVVTILLQEWFSEETLCGKQWELVILGEKPESRKVEFLENGKIVSANGEVSDQVEIDGILHIVNGNAVPLGKYRLKKEYPKLVLTPEKVDSKESEQRKADG